MKAAPVRPAGYPDRAMGRSTTAGGITHRHRFVVYEDSEKKPRSRQPSYRQVWARCECGFAERRRYSGEALIEVRYRYPGGLDWLDPVALLSTPLDVIVCPRCEGQRYDRGSCGFCGNLGVLDEDGDRIR